MRRKSNVTGVERLDQRGSGFLEWLQSERELQPARSAFVQLLRERVRERERALARLAKVVVPGRGFVPRGTVKRTRRPGGER